MFLPPPGDRQQADQLSRVKHKPATILAVIFQLFAQLIARWKLNAYFIGLQREKLQALPLWVQREILWVNFIFVCNLTRFRRVCRQTGQSFLPCLYSTVTPFALQLYADLCLFICIFFHPCWHFVKHKSYFFLVKKCKNLIILPQMKKEEYWLFLSTTIRFSPASTEGFAQELNQLVEQIKALDTQKRTKKTTNWSVSAFRG